MEIIKTYIPKKFRSEKLNGSIGGAVSVVQQTSQQSEPTPPSALDHAQLKNVHSILDENLPDNARDIHLSKEAADNLRKLAEGLFLLSKNDTVTAPADDNVFSALRTLFEIANNNEELKKIFLRKDLEDTAKEKITFDKGFISNLLSKFIQGLEIGNFTSGALGGGGAFKMVDGKSELEVDKLTVRMIATFFELVISKLRHVGGQIVLTPASLKCTRVVDGGSYYRCYFDTGTNNEVANEFVAGDQARCQVFTGSGAKMYWRLVTSVGQDYINLSKTDQFGDGVPAAGDDIVQLGNRDNPERQNAQILSTVGADAPSYKQYAGINSFSLEGKELNVISSKGNKFVGVTQFLAGSSGLENIPAFVDVKNEANKTIGVRNLLLKSNVEQSLDDYMFAQYAINKKLEIGKKYTIVVDAECDDSGSILVTLSGYVRLITPQITNGRQLRFQTFTYDFESAGTHINLYRDNPSQSGGNFKAYWACLYEGEVKPPLTWVEADEDVQERIAEAKKAGADAQNSVNATNQNVSNLNAYVDGAFKDGLIDSSEAKAIEKYTNIINAEKAGLEAIFNKIYSNEYLQGTSEKTALETSYNTYINAGVSGLLSAISTAIADGKTTIAEKQAVDVKFSEYKGHLANFQIAIENANKAIQTKLKNIGIDALSGSLVSSLEYWDDSTMATVTDGKEGDTVMRMSSQAFLNAGIYIPIDLGKKYKVRFWVRAAAGTNGLLYFSLRQFKDKGITPCAYNNGREPYHPSGYSAHTDWVLYEHIWQTPDWQSGVKFVLPEFLGNYNGTAGYWEIQGFKMYEVTEAENARLAADVAQQTASNAQSAISVTNQNVTNLNSYVDGAFKDGVIDSSEAKAIEKYINIINSEKAGLEATYNKLYGNEYLAGSAERTALETSYNTYINAGVSGLLSAINTAISDGKTTIAEKQAVDVKFSEYKGHLANFQIAIENANKAIQTKLDSISKGYVDNLKINTKNLIQNGNFARGNAWWSSMPQIKEESGIKYVTVGYEWGFNKLNFEVKKSTEYIALAKVRNANSSARFLRLLNARIEIQANSGWIVVSQVFKTPDTVYNAMYVLMDSNGDTSTIDIAELMLLEGNKAPASFIPATEDIEAGITDAKQTGINAQTTASSAQTAADALKNFTDISFRDGIIDRAEKSAIEKYLNTVNESKLSIQSSYTQLYNNSYLEGTAKSNLETAKTAFETAVTNLVSSINAAIADNATTPAEKADVDAKFNLYNTALATYQVRVEEAKKAIEDKLKGYADAAQQTANNALVKATTVEATANKSKAITDKFGTTVEGGLIQSVMMLLRDLNSITETAGISGIQGDGTKPAFWSGGTYAQALAGLAKIILRHNGSAKIGIFNVDNVTESVYVYDKDVEGLIRLLISNLPLPTAEELNNANMETHSVSCADYSLSGQTPEFIREYAETIEVTASNSRLNFKGNITAYAANTMDGSSAQLLLYKKTGATFQFMTSISGYGSTGSTDNNYTLDKTFKNLPLGIYKMALKIRIPVSGGFSFRNMVMNFEKDIDIRRVEFARNGFMMHYRTTTATRTFRMTEEEGLTIDGANIKGKITAKCAPNEYDVPGVLATGSVDSSGQLANGWGAKVGTGASYQGNGVFRINHNIGHSNYTLTVNCSVENCIVAVSTKTATYADIIITRNGSRYGSTGFDFAIYGKNYV